ncbi:MAG TPA: hypothetical protein VLT90_06340 [Terriglobales bacterium]|nr:hypothetical protein [Terriglobales bacterium]
MPDSPNAKRGSVLEGRSWTIRFWGLWMYGSGASFIGCTAGTMRGRFENGWKDPDKMKATELDVNSVAIPNTE